MMVAEQRERDAATTSDDDLRAFLFVLRRALLLVVRYIERRYEKEGIKR